MSAPLVSVIMNCYNGEEYLRQAIESVLAQTYANWEMIFWDNQSTDGSASILRSYADCRVKYFYAPTHTLLYEARNFAVEKASGEFLAFLDVDDWWLPDKLERQIPLFSDPQVGIVCAKYWVQSERKAKRWVSPKRSMPTGWVLRDLLRLYFVGLLTLIIRRSALISLDRAFDSRFHIMGDTDLVIRLAVHWKLDCVQEPLAVYRLHANNETAKHRGRMLGELDGWITEMEGVDAIRSCSTFSSIRHLCTYHKAIDRLLHAERKNAFELLLTLPWGRLKLRLFAAMLLPQFAVRRLKN